jgi:hypothetical protein
MIVGGSNLLLGVVSSIRKDPAFKKYLVAFE